MTEIKHSNLSSTENNNDVRYKLIHAGMELISKNGFEATSVRDIAAQAGQNIGSISYYFGDKQGLYTAIAEYIVGETQNTNKQHFLNLEKALDEGKLTKEEIITAIKQILSNIVSTTHHTNQFNNRVLSIWTREQICPSHVFSLMYQNVHQPVHKIFCRLIASLLNKDYDSEEIKLRSYTIMGLAVFFQSSQEAIKHRMDWNKIGDVELRLYTKIVLDHAELILRGMS